MLKYPLFIFSLSMAIALPQMAIAFELQLPPVIACQTKQGREAEIQQQFVKLEVVLYNWKMAQRDIVQLVNVYSQNGMEKTEFEQQFESLGQTFSALTEQLNLETEQLKSLAATEGDDLTQLSGAVLAHKSATLLYMRTAMGLGESGVTFEQASEQYDTTWSNLGQLWNSTYSFYGCTSTEPWIQ